MQDNVTCNDDERSDMPSTDSAILLHCSGAEVQRQVGGRIARSESAFCAVTACMPSIAMPNDERVRTSSAGVVMAALNRR